MRWITLTRFAARNPVRVNAAAIAFLDATPKGTNVSFGAGETLRVAESPAEIEALAVAAVIGATAESEHPLALPWPELPVAAADESLGHVGAAADQDRAKGSRRR